MLTQHKNHSREVNWRLEQEPRYVIDIQKSMTNTIQW